MFDMARALGRFVTVLIWMAGISIVVIVGLIVWLIILLT